LSQPLTRKPWLISAGGLLISSLVSIFLAVWLSWNLYEVVVLYWIQALIIGVFQCLKITNMVDFYYRHKSGYDVRQYHRGRRIILMTPGSAKGFAIIYGLFWLMEGGLLVAMYVTENGLSLSSFTLVLAVTALFGSHLFSYRINRTTDERLVPSVEAGMLVPLLRMFLPLHVFTVAVGFATDYGTAGILTWMLIKTCADLGIHAYQHTQPQIKKLDN